MAFQLPPNPKFQQFDTNGNPLTGGKLYTYLAGSSDPVSTYTDSSGATANTNPVILDARGEADVWISDNVIYKFVLTDASDVEIWSVDNISAAAGGSGGGGGNDEFVRVTGADLASQYLSEKMAAGTGISLNVLNAGGVEQLQIVSSADLQGVTDNGSTTTNNITVGPNFTLTGGGELGAIALSSTKTNITNINNSGLTIDNLSGSGGASSVLLSTTGSLQAGSPGQNLVDIYLDPTVDKGAVYTGLRGVAVDTADSNRLVEYDIPIVPTNYVTTDTNQTITGAKTFSNDVTLAGTIGNISWNKATDTLNINGQTVDFSGGFNVSSTSGFLWKNSGGSIAGSISEAANSFVISSFLDKLSLNGVGIDLDAGANNIDLKSSVLLNSAVDTGSSYGSGKMVYMDPTASNELKVGDIPGSTSASQQIDSSGIKSGSVITATGGNTTWDLGVGEAYIMDYSDPLNIKPKHVTWTAQTGLSLTNRLTDPRTNVAIALDSTARPDVSFTNSFTGTIDGVSGTIYIAEKSASNFDSEETRLFAPIGRIVHTNQTTISFPVQLQQHTESVLSSYLDFVNLFPAQNVEGNLYTPTTGVNLSVDKSAGKGFRFGSNYTTDLDNPNIQDIPLASPTTHFYRYQDGAGGFTQTASSTVLDVAQYDNGTGTLASVNNNQWTIQPVWVFAGSGTMFIQYGQELFSSKASAIEALATFNPVLDDNLTTDAVFRGYFIVRGGGTDTNNTDDFEWRSPLSERGGGTGTSVVVDLQTAYESSFDPEIVTDATRGALTVKRGSALDTDNVIEVQNGAGTTNFSVDGNGDVSANTLVAGGVNAIQDLDSVLTQGNISSLGATFGADVKTTSGNITAPEGFISFNQSNDTLQGLVSSWSTNDDPSGKHFVALKQQNTKSLLISGAVATTGENPLEIWISDSAGNESSKARFESNEIIMNVNLQADLDLNVDGTTYTNGGIVSYALDSSTLTGLVSTYKNTQDPLGDRFVALKQQDTKSLLISGNAGGASENPLRILTSDPTGTELIIQQLFYDRIEFSKKLQLLSTTNSTPTNGDIWYDGTGVNIQGSISTNNRLISFNESNSLIDGLLSIRGTDKDPTGKTFLGLKQQSSTAILVAGAVTPSVVANPLELWTSNSSGVESARARFEDGLVTIKEDMQAEGKLNLASTTNASPTNGDIWYDGTNTSIQGDVEVSNASDVARVTVEAPTGNAGSGASAGINLLMGGTGADWNILSTNGGNNLRFYAGGVDLMTLSSSGELYVNQGKVNIAEVLKLSSYINSSPVEGDLWYDGTNLKFRDATTTRTISWT